MLNKMRKIWEYPQDIIQCIRSNNCIDILFIFSNVIMRKHLMACLVMSASLRDSDIESENINLIWFSVPDGQKTCSSKGVSLIGR